MEFWEAIILGLVQGATEFLPVSSSGHLRVTGYFFGLSEPQTSFDLGLHAATLLAVCLFFWRDLWQMIAAPFRIPRLLRSERGVKALGEDAGLRGVGLLVLASIPTAAIGMAFGSRLEGYAESIQFVAWAFVANSLILFSSRFLVLPLASRTRLNKGFLGVRWLDALVIGTFQGLAITRGISRSGTTITAGLLMGLDRETAGRFAFLMAIPAIVGAELLALMGHGDFGAVDPGMLLAGGLAAFLAGLASLKVLMFIVKKGSLHHFGWYTLALGVGLLVWLEWGHLLGSI